MSTPARRRNGPRAGHSHRLARSGRQARYLFKNRPKPGPGPAVLKPQAARDRYEAAEVKDLLLHLAGLR